MLWIVLAIWLVVGVGTFLLALTGGPTGLGRRLVSDGTLSARLRTGLLALTAAFGIAVPIAVAIANGEDRNRVGPGGITLTPDEATGRALFAQTCATCHTLAAAAAYGHVGPDLDILLPDRSLVLYAIEHGFANGQGQMPAHLYSGQQAADVADFVAAVAGGGRGVSTPSAPAPAPAPVHVQTAVALGRQLYTSDGCSSCHSLTGAVLVGPSWKGLYGSRVTLTTGRTVTANSAYLTEHIVDPEALTVKGFPKGVMAAAIASDDLGAKPKDVAAIVAFIRSLAG